jgi:hypothetical protein
VELVVSGLGAGHEVDAGAVPNSSVGLNCTSMSISTLRLISPLARYASYRTVRDGRRASNPAQDTKDYESHSPVFTRVLRQPRDALTPIRVKSRRPDSNWGPLHYE